MDGKTVVGLILTIARLAIMNFSMSVGNVYVAEGPSSLSDAGSAFTKYEVGGM